MYLNFMNQQDFKTTIMSILEGIIKLTFQKLQVKKKLLLKDIESF